MTIDNEMPLRITQTRTSSLFRGGVLAMALAVFPVTATLAHAAKPTKNRRLKTVTGSSTTFLAKGKINALVFFSFGKNYSCDALKEMDHLRVDIAKKKMPVHFLALVSSRYAPKKVVARLQKEKVAMTVGIDDKDKLYAELKLKMRPTVVLLDKKLRVIGHLVYRRVNFENIVLAHIRHALGKISQKELDLVLHPHKRGVGTGGGQHIAALRRWRLGKMLFKAGALPGALKAVKTSIKDDNTFAPAHLLLGQILAAQKHCAAAKKAIAKALKLDPKLAPQAKAAAGACK